MPFRLMPALPVTRPNLDCVISIVWNDRSVNYLRRTSVASKFPITQLHPHPESPPSPGRPGPPGPPGLRSSSRPSRNPSRNPASYPSRNPLRNASRLFRFHPQEPPYSQLFHPQPPQLLLQPPQPFPPRPQPFPPQPLPHLPLFPQPPQPPQLLPQPFQLHISKSPFLLFVLYLMSKCRQG